MALAQGSEQYQIWIVSVFTRFPYAQVTVTWYISTSSQGSDMFWLGERIWATFCVASNTFLVWSVADIASQFTRQTVESLNNINLQLQIRSLCRFGQLVQPHSAFR
jgi:hypothetical protein